MEETSSANAVALVASWIAMIIDKEKNIILMQVFEVADYTPRIKEHTQSKDGAFSVAQLCEHLSPFTRGWYQHEVSTAGECTKCLNKI